MPDEKKPDPAATAGEPVASGEASSSDLKKDIGEAAGASGAAASTAQRAGEDVIAGALSRIEATLNDIKERLPGQPSVTKGAEAVAAPVKPAEQTAEAVVPEVKVTPRKAHWTSGLPKWM